MRVGSTVVVGVFVSTWMACSSDPPDGTDDGGVTALGAGGADPTSSQGSPADGEPEPPPGAGTPATAMRPTPVSTTSTGSEGPGGPGTSDQAATGPGITSSPAPGDTDGIDDVPGDGTVDDTPMSSAGGAGGQAGGASGQNGIGGGPVDDAEPASNMGGDGVGANGCRSPAPGTNPSRVCIRGKSYYLNGINVAWDQWGRDLTNYDAGTFEAMFAALQAAGGNSVRWWWFPTANEQLSYAGDLVQPLSQNIFDNLDRAFDAAAAHGVLIMPVLLSFDIESEGRQTLVTNEAATDAFVTNVVTPLVQRYNDHPGLGLWEIMNEGDWLLSEEGGSVSVADYQRFHGKVAAGIHAAAADALVTTGSASYKFLAGGDNILSDAALRQAAGGDDLAYLDVYQTHYYPWMHGQGWSYEPWIQTSSEWQGDGKPVLIGEFPCRGEPGRWTTMQMHVESVNQGYAGTFCWAYHDNRADDEGTWQDARPAVEAIASQVPGAITGE